MNVNEMTAHRLRLIIGPDLVRMADYCGVPVYIDPGLPPSTVELRAGQSIYSSRIRLSFDIAPATPEDFHRLLATEGREAPHSSVMSLEAHLLDWFHNERKIWTQP